MAENTRPPVAIRIVRPYLSEDDFLEHELETVGKTSVILIGAHARPTGVILRFEVTLSTGATILRGEGRVLAHKDSAFRGQPGLSLRFTRLDPRSKALVDRAAAIREAKAAGDPAGMSARPSSPPPAPSSGSSISRASSPAAEPPRASAPPAAPSRLPAARASRLVGAIAEALSAETPPPSRPSRGPRRKTGAPLPPSIPPQPPAVIARSEPTPAPAPPAPAAPPAASAAPAIEGRTVEAPANRAELLARLRNRAAALPSDRIREILSRES